jgi:hypothetical protein
MKERILQQWDWLRIVRLVIGVSVIFQSVMMQSWLLVAAGVMLTSMAVLNIGCGLNGCATMPTTKDTRTADKEVTFEEIK